MKKSKKFSIKNLLLEHPIRWMLLLLLSVGIIVAAWVFQDKLVEFKRLGPIGILLINFFASATLFIPAPGIATVVAGGAIYPPFLVAFMAALGSVGGEMLGFLIGVSGRKAFLQDHHKKYNTVMKIFKKYGGWAVFVFALVPNPVFDAIGITAGIFGYPAQKFFFLVLAGRLLRDIILAHFGSAFASHH